MSTEAGESFFVATYGAGNSDAKLSEGKERDLEAGDVKERDNENTEQVVSLDVRIDANIRPWLMIVVSTRWIANLTVIQQG